MTAEGSAVGASLTGNALAGVGEWWRRLDRGWRAVAVACIVTLIVQAGVTVPY
jgi:hypothetical protein